MVNNTFSEVEVFDADMFRDYRGDIWTTYKKKTSPIKLDFNIKGPFPADTIFSNQKKFNYNVVVGMYHDQVLAPFKALYGYNAINITLGLKYIRISPDHGIARDIVGQNKANPISLINAINFLNKIND